MNNKKIQRSRIGKHNKDQSIAKQEIITDQSDPRFIEFKKEYNDSLSKGKRKLHRLDIAEYKAKPGEMKVTMKLGFYEGEPPAAWRKFWQKIITETKISDIDHKDHDSISE